MGKKIEKDEWLGMQFSKFRDFKFENKSGSYIDELLKSLSNKETTTKRFCEILEKCELHMTNFKKFNDIDEGRYSFTEDSNIDTQKTEDAKNKRNICSFSYFEDLENLNDRQCSETLMWAHYGGSHYGIRIDFKIHTSYKGNIYKIGYIESYEQDKQIYTSQKELLGNIERILTTKKPCFRYECEYRAISSSTKRLPIIIDKITLGRRFPTEIVCSDENEKEGFEDEIKNLAKKILEVSSNKKIEIWAYKTKYSEKPKKVEIEI